MSKSTSQLGLGSARNFSSSQGAFANILANVPLGLRALGNEGIDERKWKKVKRSIRSEMKKAAKKEEWSINTRGLLSKQQEFGMYFGTNKVQQERVESSSAESVVLVISVEPTLPPLASSSQFDPYSSDYRLLPHSTLYQIQAHYRIHAQRIHQLHESLLKAGVFDDSATQVEAVGFWDELAGKEVRQVHVTFGPNWSVRDVRLAVGEWREGSECEGEEKWFWIRDLQVEKEEMEQAELYSLEDATPYEDDSIDSELVHNQVSTTFILPALDHSSSYSTPTISPIPSEATFSLYSHSPPMSPTQASDDETTSAWQEWDLNSSVFSLESINDSQEESVDAANIWSSSDDGRSYEAGIRDFLSEINSY